MKKEVKVGNLVLGDNKNVYIQTMLNVPSEDINANVLQAKKLEAAGCQIQRVAIPNKQAIALIPAIKEETTIPLVADIHFDYKLALMAIDAGIDKIRINPGNIGDSDRVKAVATACKAKNIPIRVGVNGGSLEKEILEKYGAPTPEAMVESALKQIQMLERYDFDDIVVSIKTSDVNNTVKAYRLLSQQCNYPLHLGVTETGTVYNGIIKSSVGIGALLIDSIGDTIRVSLSTDPIEEIKCAKAILRSVGILKDGVNIISCPTCGRTKIDLFKIISQVEQALDGYSKPLTVAVMGCAVNGPGEASQADIGIAGGDNCAVIFKKGEIIKKVPEEDVVTELMSLIERNE